MTMVLLVSLALLVARVLLANDANDTFSPHDLALVADLLDARTDLHGFLKTSKRGGRAFTEKTQLVQR